MVMVHSWDSWSCWWHFGWNRNVLFFLQIKHVCKMKVAAANCAKMVTNVSAKNSINFRHMCTFATADALLCDGQWSFSLALSVRVLLRESERSGFGFSTIHMSRVYSSKGMMEKKKHAWIILLVNQLVSPTKVSTFRWKLFTAKQLFYI